MAGALTAAIAAAFSGSAVVTDPYFEYTTLLLPGSGTNGAQNNTFLDGSTNNFTITRNGNTTQGTFSPFSQTGWGNYFDGTTDNLKVSNNAAFQFGTTAFTIEFWVYLTTTSGSPQPICCYQNSSTGYSISLSASAVLTANLSGDGADITGTTTVQANQWNHIALSGTGGTSVKLFLNGVQEGSTFTGSTSLSPGTYPFTIGSFAGGGFGDANFITGYMSNVRVVKGTAVYTGNFTPPSLAPLTTAGSTSAASYPSTNNVNTSFASSATSLLTCQSNRFIDNSTNNFTITPNADVRVVAFSPFNPTASWSAATYGGSGYFDGNGDYLTAPSNAAFAFGTNDFTIEFWLYPTSTTQRNVSFATANAPIVYMNASRQLEFQNYGVASIATTTNTLDLNAWNHCVATRQSGTLKLFINGVQGASVANSTNWVQSAVNVGTDSGINNCNGYMTDVRILKGTGYSTITVPTAPLTAITNTSLLLNFTNAGIYDATSKNDLETVGNAQISTAQYQFPPSSMAFDGTGDYLVVGNMSTNPILALLAGDFTIEWWYYPLNTSTHGILTNLNDSDGTGSLWVLTNGTFGGGSKVQFGYNTGSSGNILFGTSAFTINNWYHVAVCRSGINLRCFINGTQEGSTSTALGSGSITSYNRNLVTGANLNGASYTAYNLNGYIQDLRITKFARYTANFTAPTAAFPTL